MWSGNFFAPFSHSYGTAYCFHITSRFLDFVLGIRRVVLTLFLRTELYFARKKNKGFIILNFKFHKWRVMRWYSTTTCTFFRLWTTRLYRIYLSFKISKLAVVVFLHRPLFDYSCSFPKNGRKRESEKSYLLLIFVDKNDVNIYL